MLRLFLADSRRRAGQQLNCCSCPSPSLPAKKPSLQAAWGSLSVRPVYFTLHQVLRQLPSGCQERAGMLREGAQVAPERHGWLTVGPPNAFWKPQLHLTGLSRVLIQCQP